MDRFVDLTLNGLGNGAVYAAAALALVLIWRATRVLNFAQGAMLMLTTFVASAVVQATGSYALALAVAVLAGLALGALVERLVVRHIEGGPHLNAVVVTIGLLIGIQAIAGMIWGGNPRAYPPAFSIRGFDVGSRTVPFGPNDLFIIVAVAVVMALLTLLFTRTSIGLRMRAAAFQPEVARLVGVRVGRVFTLGWALACAVGAVAGVLVAPSTFVSPTSMDSLLIFGFTAAVIGGLESPLGALVGGVGLGVLLSYVAGYGGSELVTLGALVVLGVVLMVRPTGLFAYAAERRV